MRLDELPRSDNVEDRRSEDMGPGGGFRIPGGRGGLGIGTIIVLGLIGYWLGIDPRLLIGGAEFCRGAAVRNSNHIQGRETGRFEGHPRGRTLGSDGRIRVGSARRHGSAMAENFRAIRQSL